MKRWVRRHYGVCSFGLNARSHSHLLVARSANFSDRSKWWVVDSQARNAILHLVPVWKSVCPVSWISFQFWHLFYWLEFFGSSKMLVGWGFSVGGKLYRLRFITRAVNVRLNFATKGKQSPMRDCVYWTRTLWSRVYASFAWRRFWLQDATQYIFAAIENSLTNCRRRGKRFSLWIEYFILI